MTSRSGSGSSIVRRPSRASSWSSAIMIRPRRSGSWNSGSILSSSSDGARQRHLGDHLGPLAGLAVDVAMASQECDTFVHAEQSDAFPWARAILRAWHAKPPPPVTHFQSDQTVVLLE